MPEPGRMTWVLEPEVFPNGDVLCLAAIAAGHRVVDWSDRWWSGGGPPALPEPVVFHGSLGNADRIAREGGWRPGAYCSTDRFRCSSWYPGAASWLVHERWELLPAARLVAEADAVLERFGGADAAVFVRPDSPLKPFSGRVLRRGQISLAALDHGFYHDDPEIAVVVAPVRALTAEWRYVVAGRAVIAGTGYAAVGRAATPADPGGRPWQFAARVAAAIEPPDPVYVLDVCEADGVLRLLELNPFSGADLYACDGPAIVRHVAAAIAEP